MWQPQIVMEIFNGKSSLSDQALALKSSKQLEAVMKKYPEGMPSTVEVRIEGTKERIILPAIALGMMAGLLNLVASGMRASLVANEQEMTTQAAADFLMVSRPHLVSLLESNQIPFRKVGSHRRVLLQDLQAFAAKRKQEQAEAMAFLAEQAQELDLGYE